MSDMHITLASHLTPALLVKSYMACLVLLSVKHYLGDGLFQTAWQAMLKGRYGHPAGLVHAGIHALLSIIAVSVWEHLPAPYGYFVPLKTMMVVVGAEFLIHYHVDWFKARFIDTLGWQKLGDDGTGREAINIYNPRFFQAMIADQVVHFITYIFMGWYFMVLVG